MNEASDAPRSPLDRIVRSSRANIRDVWPKEDHDFTPWLAKHLDLLSEAIGIELSLEDKEYPIPGTA
jgi:hypothetical protein